MTKSDYDPNRDTVGKIYRDAQINNSEDNILIGDMTHEMKKGLVEDLNEAIQSNPYNNEPFYITVHEKKELHMKNCIARKVITTPFRPYPEDDTMVFYTNPRSQTTLFCWCLPHWSEMDNVLNNSNLYDNDYVGQIKAWKAVDLHNFGFIKDEMGNWEPNPNFKDKPLKKPVRQPLILRSQ